MVVERGRRIGFEVKFNEAPRVTKAMRTAMETLALEHLFIVCPTREACRIDHGITMLPDTEGGRSACPDRSSLRRWELCRRNRADDAEPARDNR